MENTNDSLKWKGFEVNVVPEAEWQTWTKNLEVCCKNTKLHCYLCVKGCVISEKTTVEEHSLLLSGGMPSKSSGTFDNSFSFSNRDFHRQHFILLLLHSHITALSRHL
jgi:hypothetical protein